MKSVAAIILGGGQGKRLFPLTMSRCKPAVVFGGRYRLIDIPISNAINSGCKQIYIITQFLSRSLHQHIFNTYRMGSFPTCCIDLLPVEEKPHHKNWLQGTADAVRQNLEHLMETSADYFLILSGDQLYHMDFRKMVASARESDADVVVATLPVLAEETSRMGIMRIDDRQNIVSFKEKPQDKTHLEGLQLSLNQAEQLKLDVNKPWYLGSMGIYLFKRSALFNLLQQDIREDFGQHIIPSKVDIGNITAFIHNDYWEDVGTIESFYKANMALLDGSASFVCKDEHWPFFAFQSALPGARIYDTKLKNSILCEGTIVEAKEIKNSILGPRSRVGKKTIIEDSYLMGNETLNHSSGALFDHYKIGDECHIKRAIVDKQVHIGNKVQLVNKNKLMHYDGEFIYIRDGIIVVPKGATVPDGFEI